MAKKSWKEKLNETKDLPKIVEVPDEAVSRWGGKRIAIPLPKEVDGLMKKVPKGKLQTINTIRKEVAKKHHANAGCPICCGIFSVISAHVAAEEIVEGKSVGGRTLADKVTPFWRTLKSDGSLNPKYPGGIDFQADQLEKEGFEIDCSYKIPKVKNFEKYLL